MSERDLTHPDHWIHAKGENQSVYVVIGYGGRHRGSVRLAPDAAVRLAARILDGAVKAGAADRAQPAQRLEAAIQAASDTVRASRR